MPSVTHTAAHQSGQVLRHNLLVTLHLFTEGWQSIAVIFSAEQTVGQARNVPVGLSALLVTEAVGPQMRPKQLNTLLSPKKRTASVDPFLQVRIALSKPPEPTIISTLSDCQNGVYLASCSSVGTARLMQKQSILPKSRLKTDPPASADHPGCITLGTARLQGAPTINCQDGSP